MKQIMLCAIALLGACVNVSVQASNWEVGQKELYRVSRAFAHVHKKKARVLQEASSIFKRHVWRSYDLKDKEFGEQLPISIYMNKYSSPRNEHPQWLSLDGEFHRNEIPTCSMDCGMPDSFDGELMSTSLLNNLFTYTSDDICPPISRSHETIDIGNQDPIIKLENSELECLTIREKMMLIVKMQLLPESLAYMVAYYAQESLPISYLMRDDVSPARKFEFTREFLSTFTSKNVVDTWVMPLRKYPRLGSIPILGWNFKSNPMDISESTWRYNELHRGNFRTGWNGGLGVNATDIRVKSAVENLVGRKYMVQFVPQVTATNYSNTGDGAEAMISDFVELEDVSEATQKPKVRKYNLEKMD